MNHDPSLARRRELEAKKAREFFFNVGKAIYLKAKLPIKDEKTGVLVDFFKIGLEFVFFFICRYSDNEDIPSKPYVYPAWRRENNLKLILTGQMLIDQLKLINKKHTDTPKLTLRRAAKLCAKEIKNFILELNGQDESIWVLLVKKGFEPSFYKKLKKKFKNKTREREALENLQPIDTFMCQSFLTNDVDLDSFDTCLKPIIRQDYDDTIGKD